MNSRRPTAPLKGEVPPPLGGRYLAIPGKPSDGRVPGQVHGWPIPGYTPKRSFPFRRWVRLQVQRAVRLRFFHDPIADPASRPD